MKNKKLIFDADEDIQRMLEKKKDEMKLSRASVIRLSIMEYCDGK